MPHAAPAAHAATIPLLAVAALCHQHFTRSAAQIAIRARHGLKNENEHP
ncbi:MAG: hypothetical protein ACKVQU_12000 [Burkholderiales bacterium]